MVSAEAGWQLPKVANLEMWLIPVFLGSLGKAASAC